MSENHNIILRARVEITADNHDECHALQQYVNEIVEQQLIPKLEALFTQYVPHDVVIHLDKLVVDGGFVDMSMLYEQLAPQVNRHCLQVLKEEIDRAIRHPHLYRVTPLLQAKQQAITYYLSEGNFAWWMSECSEKEIEHIYTSLLNSAPMLIEQLWYDLPKFEKSIQRFVTYFSQETIESTLMLLLKRADCVSLIGDLNKWLQQAGILVGLPHIDQKQLFAAALKSGIQRTQPHINRISFATMLLQQVADQASISYDTLLEQLSSCFKQPNNRNTDSTTLLLQLYDLAITPPMAWKARAEMEENLLHQLDQIGNQPMAPYQLSRLVRGIQEKMDRAEMRNLALNWLNEQKNRAKLIKNLPDSLFNDLIQSIDSATATLFTDATKALTHHTTRTALIKLKQVILSYMASGEERNGSLKEYNALLHNQIKNNVPEKSLKRSLADPTIAHSSEMHKMVQKQIVHYQAKNIEENSPPINGSKQLISDSIALIDNHLAKNPSEKKSETLVALRQYIAPLLSSEKHAKTNEESYPSLASLLERLIPISAARFESLEKTMMAAALSFFKDMLSTTERKQTIQALLITAALSEEMIATSAAYIEKIVRQLYHYTHISIPILYTYLIDAATAERDSALVEALRACKKNISMDGSIHFEQEIAKSTENVYTLENLITFLIENELPNYKVVPAYFIAKSIEIAEPTELYKHLAPICQDHTLVKRLLQHAPTLAIAKLLQTLLPLPSGHLEQLEKVLLHNVLHDTKERTARNILNEVLILSSTGYGYREKTILSQYIERIVIYLGPYVSLSPAALCERLETSSTVLSYLHLREIFTSLKQKLLYLGVTDIEELDLILLPANEIAENQLDMNILLHYYHHLLPEIKALASKSTLEGYQHEIKRLIDQHLPMISETASASICAMLTVGMDRALHDKKQLLMSRWELFLHTGSLGHYADGAALWKEVAMHNAFPFSLDEAVAEAHIRKRLIAHFSHADLLALVEKYSHVGRELTSYLLSGYDIFCAAQGVLSSASVTKHLFWEGVLTTLSKQPPLFHALDCMTQIMAEWSHALAIQPTLLLQTFEMIGKDIQDENKDNSFMQLTSTLHQKYQDDIGLQAKQEGATLPILENLYLLLQGGLAFFMSKHDGTLDQFESQLVDFMAEQPALCIRMLRTQIDKNSVARRIVYYFDAKVVTTIIALLSGDHAAVVMATFRLFNNLPQSSTLSTVERQAWCKAFSISVLTYLLEKDLFKERDFIESTLHAVNHNRETTNRMVTLLAKRTTADQRERQVIALLKTVELPDKRDLVDKPNLQDDKDVPTKVAKKKEKEVINSKDYSPIYIHHTGLAFLWPFFSDFLTAQQLMQDKLFVSDQAMHNSVYLLYYLATGTFAKSESELMLAKIVCGLPYDEVLMPYQHITLPEDEITYNTSSVAQEISAHALENIEQHSQAVLTQAMQRWPSLQKLQEIAAYKEGVTIDLFRDYILNRFGALVEQPMEEKEISPIWHLMIMQKEYDDLGLLPPWSTEKVHLPWMETTVKLFWI